MVKIEMTDAQQRTLLTTLTFVRDNLHQRATRMADMTSFDVLAAKVARDEIKDIIEACGGGQP